MTVKDLREGIKLLKKYDIDSIDGHFLAFLPPYLAENSEVVESLAAHGIELVRFSAKETKNDA